MKKTMVIAIIIVYILSIVAVNFFGLKIRNFDGKVYVKSIEYELELMRDEAEYGEESVDIHDEFDAEDDTVYRVFQYIPGDYNEDNLTTNPNVVLIKTHVYPDDADKKTVEYIYDSKNEERGRFYFDHATGTVYFFDSDFVLTITIKAKDGSGVTNKVVIYPAED